MENYVIYDYRVQKQSSTETGSTVNTNSTKKCKLPASFIRVSTDWIIFCYPQVGNSRVQNLLPALGCVNDWLIFSNYINTAILLKSFS